MSQMCKRCGAKCCRYFCFPIDTPTDYDEFEDVRWYLLHKGVTVHIDEGDWYISIANRCKMLGPDDLCRCYPRRPNICRKYEMENCDETGGDYGYDALFETAADLEKYARQKLGDAAFDKARAKAWGLKTKKKKRKSKKVAKAAGKKVAKAAAEKA